MENYKEKIDILLATYNGERYIAEQLESILNQSYKNIKVLIRDDNSNDETLKILDKYKSRYPLKIEVYKDEKRNLGCSANFRYLIRKSTADYIMFCDQDDVWKSDKIQKMMQVMKDKEVNKNIPVLIHSDLAVVNSELSMIAPSFFAYNDINPKNNRLNNLMTINTVTGCATLINKALLQYLVDFPSELTLHDRWAALCASCFGEIYYLDSITVLYRQHEANVVGAINARKLDYIFSVIRDSQKYKEGVLEDYQLIEFFVERFKGQISKDKLEVLQGFLSMKNETIIKKIHIAKRYQFRKNSLLKTLGWIYYA